MANGLIMQRTDKGIDGRTMMMLEAGVLKQRKGCECQWEVEGGMCVCLCA